MQNPLLSGIVVTTVVGIKRGEKEEEIRSSY